MTSEKPSDNQEVFPWHLGVFDAHCHPTDTVQSFSSILKMKAKLLTAMATRNQDQHLVAQLSETYGITHATVSAMLQNDGDRTNEPCQVVPAFGWHPWFSHQLYDDTLLDLSKVPLQDGDKIRHYKTVLCPEPTDDFLSSLPDPQPLSIFLAQTRRYLARFQHALIGEIGLDRAFRIPDHRLPSVKIETPSCLTPGGREGKRLTPYRVSLDHQRAILKAQLGLAAELSRAVSVHGVAAHGAVFEVLHETWKGYENVMTSKKSKRRSSLVDDANSNDDETRADDQGSNLEAPSPFPPRICLHSYSGPPDLLKQYFHPSVPALIFFSFSRLVNFSPAPSKAVDVIKVIPDDRILVESDLHSAGQQMDDLLEQIVRSICEIRNWSLEEGVRQLAMNSLQFLFGGKVDKIRDQNDYK